MSQAISFMFVKTIFTNILLFATNIQKKFNSARITRPKMGTKWPKLFKNFLIRNITNLEFCAKF
jgi:hypothetical protein